MSGFSGRTDPELGSGVDFIVTEEDLRVLLAVARGRMSIAAAHTTLARRRWSRRDASDFLALAAAAPRTIAGNPSPLVGPA